jgi:hypothetical protein
MERVRWCIALVTVCVVSQVGWGQTREMPPTAQVLQGLPIVFERGDGSRPQSMVARAGTLGLEMRPGLVSVQTAGAGSAPLEIRFAGASMAAPEPTDQLDSYTTYLLGSDPSRWRRKIANYARVRYRDLYPGISAVFYGKGPHLEHDFIVSPGADYRKIRLQFSSGTRVSLSSRGVLMKRKDVEFALQAPVVYQEGPHGREMRKGSFRRLNDREVGFSVAGYDRSRPLVIDPVLTYETYLSQFANDALGVATNATGETFVTGYASYHMQASPGSFDGCGTCTTNGVVTFVSKLSADGSKLIYSTLLGGNAFAQPTGIAVDTAGNAVVSGWTGSTDFPTKSGQLVDTSNNNYSGFLVSLSPDGSALNYGTLIGAKKGTTASPMTYATALALDNAGNAYVTGETGHGFPVTSGALDNETQGMTSYNQFLVYVQKFTAAGNLVYSAILGTADPQSGGGGPIGASAIAVDSTGKAFVTGQAGLLWPTTSKAYEKALPPNDTYAAPFVAQVSSDGSTLGYSTFLGYAWQMHGISVLANGNVFVTGENPDLSYPTTADAFEPVSAGGSMLSELDPTGATLLYSTGLNLTVSGMAVAPSGDVWVVGSGTDAFPLSNPLQGTVPISPLSGNGPAALVAQFDSKAQKLKFSTFLGGPAVGFASAIAIDSKNQAHIGGAASYTLYANPEAYLGAVQQPGVGGGGWIWAFVAQIDPSVSAPAVCANPEGGLFFQTVPTGSWKDLSVTLSNCGAMPLSITSVTSSLPVYTLTSNNCTGQIEVGGQCDVTVRYAPTVNSTDYGWLRIDGNVSMPAFIDLAGTGMDSPVATLSAASITFGPQLVGTQSEPQKLTVTNSGRAPLTFFSIGYNSARLDDFKFSSTCPFSLGPGESCEADMVFTPTTTGTALAAISLNDNAGMQVVNVTGIAAATPFSFDNQAGVNTSATVTAGQPATYLLALTGAGGYNGTVSLSCSGLPAHAGCNINPSSIQVASGKTVNFSVTITTASTSSAAVKIAALFGLPFLLGWCRPVRNKRQWMILLTLGLSLVCLTACGGGSSVSAGVSGNTVLPGTYTLQVVATDGKSNLSQNVTLKVQ